jgi:hypothetical protein
MTLSSHDTLREVDRRQQEAHQLTTQAFQSYQNTHAYLEQRISNIDASLADMRVEQYRDMAAIQESVVRSIQPLLNQTEKMMMTLQQSSHPHHLARGQSHALPGSTASGLSVPTLQVSATISSSQCPRGCKCRCHTRSSLRTPSLLRGMLGQLQWSYKSSISLKSCNHPMCRKSVSNQHFTYYFPRWLVSRAFVASANLDNIFGARGRAYCMVVGDSRQRRRAATLTCARQKLDVREKSVGPIDHACKLVHLIATSSLIAFELIWEIR